MPPRSVSPSRLLALLPLLSLAGCGQIGPLFLRMPTVAFPSTLPPPVLRPRDLLLADCIYEDERRQTATGMPLNLLLLPPPGSTRAPAVSAAPMETADADGVPQLTPAPCVLQPPVTLPGAVLAPLPAPAAATQGPAQP
ncbi:MAG TPA: hypothetical protein VF651_02920 [Gammaproteobacteria bacterium]